jgi:hypothetical protein
MYPRANWYPTHSFMYVSMRRWPNRFQVAMKSARNDAAIVAQAANRAALTDPGCRPRLGASPRDAEPPMG